MMRRICVLLCLLAMLVSMAVSVSASGISQIQSLIETHRFGGADKAEKLKQKLELLSAEDPVQGEIWRQILTVWDQVEQMPVPDAVLPDGLPEDDSLAIVVMGFRLEENGDMKPELLQRLQAALDSARKYPEALLICTGGATAKYAQVTEAEAMKNWLVEQGLPENRVVAETRANSSLDNARYTYRLLMEEYPQVDTIALVTSEYHIPRCTMIFTAVGLYETPRNAYDLAGSAVCITGRTGNNEAKQTADNLLQIARESKVPDWDLSQPETEPETTEAATEPAETRSTVPVMEVPETQIAPQMQESEAEPAVPGWVGIAMAAMLLAAFVLLVILIRLLRKG